MHDPGNRPTRAAATFTVTTTSASTVVVATGELDSTVAAHLHGHLGDEIFLRPRALIVDLTRVSFCCTRTISALLAATADAHAAGIPCVVVSDRHAVRRPIEKLELTQVLHVHDTVEAAREALEVLHDVAGSAAKSPQ